MHEDKGTYSMTTISKERWQKIFGKPEQRQKEDPLKKRGPKARLRNKEDWTNRGPRWV